MIGSVSSVPRPRLHVVRCINVFLRRVLASTTTNVVLVFAGVLVVSRFSIS